MVPEVARTDLAGTVPTPPLPRCRARFGAVLPSTADALSVIVAFGIDDAESFYRARAIVFSITMRCAARARELETA
jgi:hypothetical protein